ncbi:hypothetical protein FGG08_003832 [Glutinoglossum americanum]|uniref:Nucleoporin NSP1 n=1 Tax=Glutinoglossum americanum TaxID=1670608 RepID=A0A9P8I1R7_9PEZI|nr:hypothetical protein FGG08_003832 [Glutinoglossum americanum]
MSDPQKFSFGAASSGGSGGSLFGSSSASTNPFGATTGAPSTTAGGFFGGAGATTGGAQSSPFGGTTGVGTNAQNTSSLFGSNNAFSSGASQPATTGFSFGGGLGSGSGLSSAPTGGLFTPNKTSASSNAGQTQTGDLFGASSNPTPGTSGIFSGSGLNTGGAPAVYTTPASSTPASSKPFGEGLFGQNPSTTPAGPPPSAANVSGIGTGGFFQTTPQQQFGGQANAPAANKPGSLFGGQGSTPTTSQQTSTAAAPLTLFGGASHATGGLFGGQKVIPSEPAPGQASDSLFKSTGGSSLFGNPSSQVSAPQSSSTSPFPTSSAPASAAITTTSAASGLAGQKPLGFAAPSVSQLSTKPLFPSIGGGSSSAATTKSPLSFSSTPPQPPAAPLAGLGGSPFNFPHASSTSSVPVPTSPASGSTVNLFGGLGRTSEAASSTAGAAPNTATLAGSSVSTAPTTAATTTSAPATSLFGATAAASSSAPSSSTFGVTTTAAPSSTPTSNPFATATTAASSSAAASRPIGATATAPPTTAAPAGGLSGSTSGPTPAPQSRLKNKTMEEILNRWASDLSKYQKEFQNQADKVASWDKLLVENGKKISELYNATFDAERQSTEVERQLSQVESQQEELGGWLDKYEREVDELYTRQVGHGDTLQGPDQERERTYKLAEKLNDRLEDMGKDLTSMIEEINNASSSLSKSNKSDDPLSQIVRVLNSHLSQLQWIDQNTAAVRTKVEAARKVGQGIGSGGYGGLREEATDDFYKSFRGRR